jgi:hypothetical protein
MTHSVNIEPVARAERLAVLDVLRGFALLGILLANVRPHGAHELPAAEPGLCVHLLRIRAWPDRAHRSGAGGAHRDDDLCRAGTAERSLAPPLRIRPDGMDVASADLPRRSADARQVSAGTISLVVCGLGLCGGAEV